MKRLMLIILALVFVFFVANAGNPGDCGFKGKFKKSETIEKDLAFTGGAQGRALDIDNVSGGFDVKGYNGKTVKLTVEKTIRAVSGEQLQEAEKDVKLTISNKDNTIKAF